MTGRLKRWGYRDKLPTWSSALPFSESVTSWGLSSGERVARGTSSCVCQQLRDQKGLVFADPWSVFREFYSIPFEASVLAGIGAGLQEPRPKWSGRVLTESGVGAVGSICSGTGGPSGLAGEIPLLPAYNQSGLQGSSLRGGIKLTVGSCIGPQTVLLLRRRSISRAAEYRIELPVICTRSLALSLG